MPEKRKRVTAGGKPRPCVVRIHSSIAATLYRERLDGRFRDETELANAVLREWAKSLPPVDWPALAARLKSEESEQSPSDA